MQPKCQDLEGSSPQEGLWPEVPDRNRLCSGPGGSPASVTLGNAKDLFKEIRDTKGTFHAKVGTINHRNSKGLMEAKEIKRSGKKNYTKKILMTQITTMVWSLT